MKKGQGRSGFDIDHPIDQIYLINLLKHWIAGLGLRTEHGSPEI